MTTYLHGRDECATCGQAIHRGRTDWWESPTTVGKDWWHDTADRSREHVAKPRKG